MPQIIMGAQQTGTNKLDGTVKKQAYAFLEKLSESDSLPGLHVEPINGSVDPRVRTGRVNDFYRAVMFRVQGQGTEAHYVYLGVWPHDEAITVAKKAQLSVNPVNGIAELILASDPPTAATVAPVVLAEPDAPVVAEPKAIPPATPLLAALGVTESTLVDDLGIDRQLAAAAMAVTSEDQLEELASDALQWQCLALIDLAGGKSVADTKAALGIDLEPSALEVDDLDEQLLVALQHPASRMQFAFIEDNEELRRAIEDEDFAAWRVFLHPEQRKYATRSYSGPFRLSGGAGTGKTVVLLHRARHLSRENPDARIVLTTFTTTLAEALRNDLARLDPSLIQTTTLGEPGVYVAGIDSTVSAVLKADDGAGAADVTTVLGSRSSQIGQRTESSKVWAELIDAAGPDLPLELRSPAFFSAEYAMVALPLRITSADDYYRARRPGRGVSLDRKKRIAVWSVIESYRARTSIDGSLDFLEAASIAAARLDRRAAAAEGRPADHVLVDEGQDLNPSHWRFLRSLAAEGPNDLFIAEDSHQRIYGQRVVLGRYGIRIVGRSQRLTLNYRTTAQNLHFAVGVLSGADYVDLEEGPEDSQHYRSARRGPVPQLIETKSLTEELDRLAEIVAAWTAETSAAETIGILVRDAQQAGQVTRGLEERGVTVRLVERKSTRTGQPQVMTMHRAKGMEFARVAIFGAGEGSIPASYLLKNVNEADRSDVLLRERSLLYVAATRARDELVVIWAGKQSPMLSTSF